MPGLPENEMSDEVLALVRDEVKDEEIKLALKSDLGLRDLTDREWIILTSERLIVVTESDSSPRLAHNFLLCDVVSVTAESLVGNNCITANVNGIFIPIVRYSNALSRELGFATRVIHAACTGEPEPTKTDSDTTQRCPTCTFPLMHGSKVCPNCVDRGQAIRRLLNYVRPYALLSIISTILVMLSQSLMLAPPYLTKILVDDVLKLGETTTRFADPTFARAVLMHKLGWIVFALLLANAISSGIGIIVTRLIARLGTSVVHDIRMEVYGALQRLTMGFYDKRHTGTVISRVSQDTSSLQQFLSDDIQYMVTNILMLVLVLTIMFTQNWRLAALTILPAPFVSFATTIIIKRIRWMYSRQYRRWARMYAVISDALSGLKVVKVFAQEEREEDRFRRRSEGLRQASREATQVYGTLIPILIFMLTAGQFIVWYAGGRMVIGGTVTTGTLIMFIGYIGMLYGPIQVVTRIWDWLGRCLAASERVFEMIDSQREESDTQKSIHLPNMIGSVTFEHVTFGYDPNHPVLNDVSLEVEAGEMIGLVGRSGAGKSTMMTLLERFYLPQQGSIKVDGIDLRDLPLEDLRRQIGIVPQESYLFAGTIAENIGYGQPKASIEEIIEAAKAANAHDFIVNSPDGYESQCGERGLSLSGGERQRISIARAILHNPRILILDEATSSVDTVTEKQIQEALNRLVSNRTTFAIAHRLSTLDRANRLVVLDKGKVAEVGTHKELIERGGVYARMIQTQQEMAGIMGVT